MTGLTRGTVVLAEGTAQAKVGKWGVGPAPGVLQVSGEGACAEQGSKTEVYLGAAARPGSALNAGDGRADGAARKILGSARPPVFCSNGFSPRTSRASLPMSLGFLECPVGTDGSLGSPRDWRCRHCPREPRSLGRAEGDATGWGRLGDGRGQAWPIRSGASVWRSGLRIPAISGVGVNSC